MQAAKLAELVDKAYEADGLILAALAGVSPVGDTLAEFVASEILMGKTSGTVDAEFVQGAIALAETARAELSRVLDALQRAADSIEKGD